MDLKADKTLGMGLELLLVHEVGYLLVVDPGPDARSFGEDTVLVPFPVLEVLVGLELVLGRHPSATGFTIDVAGLGSVALGRLDLYLRTVNPTELVSPFLFLVVQGFRLGTDLHARVELVIDKLDLELKLEVPIELVRAKEGIRTAFLGRAEDGAVLDDVGGGSVLLRPAFERLAVEDGLEFSGLVMLGAEA